MCACVHLLPLQLLLLLLLERRCRGSVTCLSLSIDGSTLASGSTDATVRLWSTQSQQCIKVIQHSGLSFKPSVF